MNVLDFVGLVSGLLAIFSFMTGVTSARGLLRPKSNPARASWPRAFRPKVVLWVSVPVFLVSMAIALSAGLAGSDTGGAQFVLLLGAALLLLLYGTWMHRVLSWSRYMVLCVVVLSVGGLGMGIVSRGEEVEGIVAGILVGVGAGLLGLAVPTSQALRSAPPTAPSGSSDRTRQEREVLRAAREHGGELSVTEVALSTPLSLDEAQALLAEMTARGFCHRVSHSSGAVTYRFPDFLR